MPHRFARWLKADKYPQLTDMVKTGKDVRLVGRCHAILLFADGWPVPKMAELLRVDQSTIHRWLDCFEADGIQGLPIQWSSGRLSSWDETYESLLVETVRDDLGW